MAHDIQSAANDLISALGALGVAQETDAAADDISELTERAIELKDALLSSLSGGLSPAEAY